MRAREAPIRVLVVDDEPLARRRLVALLEHEPGVEVVGWAGDGRSAVAEVRRLAPDLLLLDVAMPEMDGFEVLDRLGPHAPPDTIFVTAYDRYAVRAFDAHAVDYLLKPVERVREIRTQAHGGRGHHRQHARGAGVHPSLGPGWWRPARERSAFARPSAPCTRATAAYSAVRRGARPIGRQGVAPGRGRSPRASRCSSPPGALSCQ